MSWQRTSGYNARAGAEGAMSRYKRIIGDTLRSHTRLTQEKPGSPSLSSTECSTARNPSAPPDDQGTRVALRSPASVHQSSAGFNGKLGSSFSQLFHSVDPASELAMAA